MMDKTLSQIIEAVKDGEKPDYDELRFAVLALASLHAFDGQDMLRVYEESPDVPFGLRFWAEEGFNRSKRAMAVPPKQYVGDKFNPDNPAYQKERAMWKKLADKIIGSE